MTITTVGIICDVGTPDNAEFTAARMAFTLSGPDYDTASNDAIPGMSVVVDLSGTGTITANLWPVDRGTRNTNYIVTLAGSQIIDGRSVVKTYTLGTITPPEAGAPHNLADLLAQSSGGILVGSIIYATLADAVQAALDAAAAGADPIAAIAARDAAELARDAAEAAAAIALAGSPFRVPTFADLDRLVYSAPSGDEFVVATGDIVDVPSLASFEVAASGTPPVAPYIQPAGAAVLRVLPDGRGVYSTKSFGTGNLSDQFARAMAAVKEDRDKTDLFYNDTPALIIPRGLYDLDAPLVLSDLTDFHLYAKGAVIRSLTETFTPFTMVAVRRSHIEGLTLDLRNNNVAAQAFHMAGSNGWNEITNLSVQSNSSNAAFAAVRMQQGTVGGLTDGVRDNGNFWTKFENLWLRKLSGADLNITPIGIDMQGAQNATFLTNCAFGNIGTGVLVRNQNNSLTSGMSNDIQLQQCRFEGFTTGFKFQADGGATGGMASFAAFGCRFEAGTTCFENATNNQGSGPMVIVGTTRISSVPNLTVDARSVKDSFVVIGGGSTPKAPNNLTNYERTKFANLGGASDGPTIEMLPRAAANGGNIALIRADGTTVDGKISQRAGGGLEIDGGTAGFVTVKNVSGLSGSATLANNFRGSATLAGGATSVVVTFATAEPDATYWVFTEFQIDNGGAWITAKGTGGFTINVKTGFASASTVRWMIVR